MANSYEKLTFGLEKTLEKRPGICDVEISEKAPATVYSINTWEQKQNCTMPEDLKNFYLTTNGFSARWSVRMNADMSIPVGRIQINEVEKLNRLTFGTVGGSSDQSLPVMADLHLDSDDESQDAEACTKPKFDHQSRIFELDACDGYSKVCLVYRGTKVGTTAQSADIWLLDRALRWHFLAPTFIDYYCQMMIHVGLPQWQLAFTDMGLLPQAKQWFNLYCPTRMNVSRADELSLSLESASSQQLDVAKVFKGKIDKKKPIGSQVIKKKFPPTLPPKPGSGKASSSNISGSKPGATS